MTISNVTNRTSATGAGAALAIAYSFPTTASGDLTVIQRVTSSGAETELTEGADYTATYSNTGGTVTTVTSVPSTDTVTVVRTNSRTQALDLAQGGSFSAENLETALDKNATVSIDNALEIARCVRAADTDVDGIDMQLPDSKARAGKTFTFDDDGVPQMSTESTVGSVTFGTFGEIMAANNTAGEARTDLVLVIGTDVQAWDEELDEIAALANTDGNFIVGTGTVWTVESGSTAMDSLGISTFAQTILDDTSALAVRTTIGAGVLDTADILCYEGDVLTHDNEVLTWEI